MRVEKFNEVFLAETVCASKSSTKFFCDTSIRVECVSKSVTKFFFAQTCCVSKSSTKFFRVECVSKSVTKFFQHQIRATQKASGTRRASQAVPHPSTDRALRCLTSEFGWDRVHSSQYGRWQNTLKELNPPPKHFKPDSLPLCEATGAARPPQDQTVFGKAKTVGS